MNYIFNNRQGHSLAPLPMPTPALLPSPVQLQQALPTGIPTGPATGPIPIPTAQAQPSGAPVVSSAGVPTANNTMYTPGYLRTQIGKRMKITFLIGSNSTIDRSGTLMSVGTSYIIIRETDTDDLTLCDIYSIKFVLVYY